MKGLLHQGREGKYLRRYFKNERDPIGSRLLEINHKAANNKGKTFYYYLANDVTSTKRIHAWEGCTFVICLHGQYPYLQCTGCTKRLPCDE